MKTQFIEFYEGNQDGLVILIALESIEYIKRHEDDGGKPNGLYTIKMKSNYIMKGSICAESMSGINLF